MQARFTKLFVKDRAARRNGRVTMRNGGVMRQISWFDFVNEPGGAVLSNLFEALARISASVAVVVRDQLDVGESTKNLLARLEPHLVERSRVTSWPGTILYGSLATLHRFCANRSVLKELVSASTALYGWLQPALPEDPSFAREDGKTVFGSISHEREAWLEVSEEERGALVREMPGMEAMVRRRQ
jgi:hypothetical protein